MAVIAMQALPGNHFGWSFLASVVTLALSILSFYAQALAPAMYLRARTGLSPSINQMREVTGYQGLWSIFWGLFGRYVVWGLPLMAIAYGIGYLQGRILTAHHHPTFAGPGLTDIRGIGFWFMLVVAIPILARYALALPLLAIFRGSELDLVDLSVKMTKPVLLPIALLAYAFAAPGVVAMVVTDLSPWHPSTLAARLAVEIWWAAISRCYEAWSLLLMTAIALQLMEQESPAMGAADEASAGNLLYLPGAPETLG